MRAFSLVGLLAISSLGACGSEPSHHHDEPVNCAAEQNIDDFVLGMQKAGMDGVLGLELVSATPAPPARGDNDWLVRIHTLEDGGAFGELVDGADIEVTPFMPAHQHGTGVVTEVLPQSSSGQYLLKPVNLWMPGVWEVTIDVTSDAGSDTFVLRACIPS
jgi:hypothetical protein